MRPLLTREQILSQREERKAGKRRKPIARTKYLPRSTKPIAKRGRAKIRREKEYAAYLRSPAWKAYRRRVFERDGYRCVDCGAEAGWFKNGLRDMRGLECDHETYIRLFREDINDCRTRCRECHRRKHAGGWHKRKIA